MLFKVNLYYSHACVNSVCVCVCMFVYVVLAWRVKLSPSGGGITEDGVQA